MSGILGLLIRATLLLIALRLVVRNDATKRDFGQIAQVALVIGVIDLLLGFLMGQSLMGAGILLVVMFLIIGSIFQLNAGATIGVVLAYVGLQMGLTKLFSDSAEPYESASETEETFENGFEPVSY